MAFMTLKDIDVCYDKKKQVLKGLNLEVEEGELVSLLGPSGCGKTTTLRVVAGFIEPQGGIFSLDGADLTKVPVHKRNFGIVFQSYALFPHLSVYNNVAFGLKIRKLDKAEMDKKVKNILEVCGLTEFASRFPQQMSGGQRQRVALARALVIEPKLLLLDEPLSNLDAKLRNQMRTELIELHKQLGTTFVYVTHDQTEAMSMATDIVLMNQGEIKQVDSPEKIYNDPDNLFAAQFIGNPTMNLFKREEMDPLLRLPVDIETIGFRPSKVRLLETGDTVSEGELVTSGPILTRELMGSEIIYRIQAPFGVITFKTFNEKQLPEDQTVRAAVMKKSMFFFDKAGRRVRV